MVARWYSGDWRDWLKNWQKNGTKLYYAQLYYAQYMTWNYEIENSIAHKWLLFMCIRLQS